MMKLRHTLAALAAFSLASALPLQAGYYWLLCGDLKNKAGTRSDLNGNGLGCWLELTNDTAGVEYKPVRIYDIRRKTTGGTDIVKYSDGNDVEIRFRSVARTEPPTRSSRSPRTAFPATTSSAQSC